jgi:hypothetical protein
LARLFTDSAVVFMASSALEDVVLGFITLSLQ